MSEPKQDPRAIELKDEELEQVSGGTIVNGGCILIPPTDPPPTFPEF